jgi:hypothetical protein
MHPLSVTQKELQSFWVANNIKRLQPLTDFLCTLAYIQHINIWSNTRTSFCVYEVAFVPGTSSHTLYSFRKDIPTDILPTRHIAMNTIPYGFAILFYNMCVTESSDHPIPWETNTKADRYNQYITLYSASQTPAMSFKDFRTELKKYKSKYMSILSKTSYWKRLVIVK